MDSVRKFVDVVYTRFGILVANILALFGNNQSIEGRSRCILKVSREAEMKTEGQVVTLLRLLDRDIDATHETVK